MNEIGSAQVRKIRKYSGYARPVCSALAVLCVLSAGFVLSVLVGEDWSGHRWLKGAAEHFGGTTAMTWILASVSVGTLLWGVIAWLLRRMFDNFSRGEIFHAANVREIRRIAFVVLLIAVKKSLVLIGVLLLSIQGRFAVEPSALIKQNIPPGALSLLAVAGILYLASWIMRVGLGINDEATELRRDAELVV